MIRPTIILSCLLLFSCADSTSETTAENPEESNEIVLDENRIDAVEVNNDFIGMYDGMTALITELFLSDSASVDLNYENALFESKSIIDRLQVYPIDSEDHAFKNSLIDLMKFYEAELENGFKMMIPLIKKSNRSNEENKELESYDLGFADKEKELVLAFAAAQEEFAKQNNIRLE